ncbi:GntR family transcriptional regulator [Pontibacillus halophilus JSM 076056 = DSM 19796]|uniref:GntR family transcriptional regulator n=1 Tax=Pontibacillus halophilus JSM 076056 = DSM 19796 TaxID=1385510 RepID=A0A0A5HYG7_9BACI|nr:FadR/GntR family transcriptional regulator [Pontibacillus halophilus]KGX88662.1 GntR family transcriptional regulator [Pontibacillus halophilus JSM 076056 = DSM 19796]
MEYKPITTKKIYEQVADSLLESLRNGTLKSGDKLDSVEVLAKNFKVGRSAIREALSALRAMGILEMRQGEGTYVRAFDASRFSLPVSVGLLMTPEDLRELLEVRKILEVGAAGSAAVTRTEEDLVLIKEALQNMEDAKGNGEIGDQADLAFHLALVKATHNQMLINLMNSVSEIMVQAMRETRKLLHTPEGTEQLLEEHRLILQGIESRDEAKAKEAMVTHLSNVEISLADYIR